MAGTNYPNGFASGIFLRGVPITQTHPGRVFWVSNVTAYPPNQNKPGSDGARGTFQEPLATIAGALLKCQANSGDVIFVKPGHAETITTAGQLALNVAGVAIIGLGVGTNRPTLTFGAAAANIPVTAANVSVSNILHLGNFADIVSAYTATGTAAPKEFTLDGNEFRDVASNKNFIKTFTGNATANSCDGFYYGNNKVYGLATTAATQACIMAAANDRQTYFGNWIVYPALSDTATLVAFGANAHTNLLMERNKLFRPSTSSTGGLVFSGGGTTSTGLVLWNEMWHLDNSAGLLFPTGTALGFSNNYGMVTGAADKSALINPVAV